MNNWCSLALLALASIVLTLMSSPCSAQGQALKQLEPQRFALVIGNGQKYTGSLPPLGSPCSDAKEIKKALIEVGLNDADVVLECDKTTDEMRTLLNRFMERVLNTERALGLFYFSGHGAQVGGRNYIFGVDATIDTEKEVETYSQNRNAPLFMTTAVELGELSRLTRLWGKGVVVLIDACRNNTLIDEMLDKGFRGDISYPTGTTDIDGVLYGFATKRGEVAPSSGLNRLSPYTDQLAKHIVSYADRTIDELIIATKTAVRRRSRERQIPDRSGGLIDPPKFCLRGCPSPADQFKSWEDEFGGRQGELKLPSESHTRVQFASTSSWPTAHFQSDERGTAFRSGVSHPVLAQTQSDQNAINKDGAQLRGMRFDIFWCQGDDKQNARRAAAEKLAEQLKTASEPLYGYKLGEVKVKSLPSRINALAQYRVSQNVAYYDRGREEEKAWATQLTKSSDVPIAVKETTRLSPDYVSVFLCEGADPDRVTPTVYIQASDNAHVDSTQSLVKNLRSTLDNMQVESQIEVVKSTPESTEIRYFYDAQKQDAQKLAAQLEALGGGTIKVRKIKGFERKLQGSPVIEVWISNTSPLNEGCCKDR